MRLSGPCFWSMFRYTVSVFFFFSSRRRHTRCLSDWSSDVCSSDLAPRLPRGTRPTTNRVAEREHLGLLADPQSGACLGEAEVHLARVPRQPPCRERSEERRVGKEGRSEGSRQHDKLDSSTHRVASH